MSMLAATCILMVVVNVALLVRLWVKMNNGQL
jgi:hypothetical protein